MASAVQVSVALGTIACAILLAGCGNHNAPPPDLAMMRGIAAVTRDEPWESKLEKMAEQAVIDAWQHHRIALDFTTNSVQSEERVLAQMHRSPSFQAFSEKDKRAEALIAGAYIGEVIRRNHKGAWGTNSEVGGDFSMPIRFTDHEAFPITWCLKRLVNGPEDNVWHKYLFFVVGITNGIPVTPTYYSNREEWRKVNAPTTNRAR